MLTLAIHIQLMMFNMLMSLFLQTLVSDQYHRHDILKQGMNNPSEKWLKQLPSLADYFEQVLYRQAGSIDEYNDYTTLANRMKESCMPPKPTWHSDTYLPQRRAMILKM